MAVDIGEQRAAEADVSEGDSAQVFASAKTSDGAYVTMTKADLNVSSSVLLVTKATTLTVPVGAAKTEGCGIVKVAWWSCGVEVAHTNPYVFVNLPAVTGVTVTLVTNRVIFFKSDPLASAPVNRPTSTQVQVMVTFANDQVKDFSKDKRAMLSVSSAALGEVYNKHYVRTPATRGTADATPYGDVVITASLGAYAPGISGKVTLKVDKFDSLALSSAAYPSCNTAGCNGKTTIYRLPRGSGDGRSKKPAIFQRVKLSLQAKSKLDSTFVVDALYFIISFVCR